MSNDDGDAGQHGALLIDDSASDFRGALLSQQGGCEDEDAYDRDCESPQHANLQVKPATARAN